MKILIIFSIMTFLSCSKPTKIILINSDDPAIEVSLEKRKINPDKYPVINKIENEDCFERYDGTIKCIPHDDIVRATKLKGTALKEFVDSILLPQPQNEEKK